MVTMYWRKVEGRKPWVLNVLMNQNSNDCITQIERNLKKLNVKIHKEYEKKRMIMESEVSKNALGAIKIDSLLVTIKQFEDKMKDRVEHVTAKHLIALYNKAVEYYSALDDDKHVEYLIKLQKLLAND